MSRLARIIALLLCLAASSCASTTPVPTTNLPPLTDTSAPSATDTPTPLPSPTVAVRPLISKDTILSLSPIATWPSTETLTLAWSPDSTWFAAGDYEDMYRYPVSGAPRELILSEANPFAISPAAPSLVFQPWIGDLSVLRLPSMVPEFSIPSPTRCPLGLVTSLAISRDGNTVAIGHEIEGGRDLPTASAVTLWDARAGSCKTVLPRLQGGIWDLSISPDANWLIVSTNYYDAFLYEAKSDTHTCSFIALSAQFNPAQNLFALHNIGDNVISIWDPDDCRNTSALWGLEDDPERDVSTLYPGAMAFTHDGAHLAAAPCYERGYLRVWDAQDPDPITTITHPSGSICKVAFSPDGRYMATAVRDPTTSYDTGDTLVLWAIPQ
ncbi:MAG TPA: hypothetical protein VJP78_08895 [Thermoleophilia bacterium]|nr:hypothetical protein [Thermoleophilia bacterium]